MSEDEKQQLTCKNSRCPSSDPVVLIKKPVTMATTQGEIPLSLFCPVCMTDYAEQKGE